MHDVANNHKHTMSQHIYDIGSNYRLGQRVIVLEDNVEGYISAQWEDENGDVAMTVTGDDHADYEPLYEHEIRTANQPKHTQ